MMTRKMSKKRVQSILYGGDEPTFDNIDKDADLDLVLEKAVNWYRQSFKQRFDQESSREWVRDWLVSEGKDASCVSGFSKHSLKFISPYCRCSVRGFPMSDANKDFIQRGIDSATKESRGSSSSKDAASNTSIQDSIRSKADAFLLELEPVLDNMIEVVMKSKKKVNPLLSWVDNANLNRPIGKIIEERLQASYSDIRAAYDKTDADLVEGYSYMSRPNQKMLLKYLGEGMERIGNRMTALKANRKPRKKKIKSPDVQVKGLKFMERSDEYGIDSIKPSAIIGSPRFIVFNTKNNKATLFESSDAVNGLSVKGSTIIGFDETTSFEKTVRKPEEFVKNLTGCRKTFASSVKYLNGIRTKKTVPTGRVNKHCIILQVQQ